MKFFDTQEDVRKQLIVCFILYIGNTVVGVFVVWSSPMIVKLQDADSTPLPYELTDGQASWVASITYIGTITGLFVSGKLSNIIGRKYSIITGGLISILGLSLMTAAKNVAMLYAGRIIIGFATSLMIVSTLVMVSEIVSPSIRGILLTLTGVFQSFGSLLSFAIGPFLSYSVYHYIILALQVVHLIGILFIPESPVFQLMKGRIEKAEKTYQNLGRKDIEKELEAISENIKQSQEQKWEFHELFTIRSNRRGLIICLVLYLLQQCGGVMAISMFSLTIFQNAGTPMSPNVANIIFGGTQFLGTLIAPVFVDKSGRKILLLISTAGICVSMALLGVYFYLDYIEHVVVESIGWLPLVAMITALMSFNAGITIIPNTLLGEVFRSNVRSFGFSVCMSLGFLAGFGVILAFGYIMSGMGIFISFFVFTVINALGIVFIVLAVPETKGLTLTEIQEMLSK